MAKWFHERAVEHGKFEASLVDLADFNLPIYDEPEHPKLQKYRHDHTKAWSASVQAADAFVFVTPEYNYGPPPSLLNALNFLYNEWNYKPAAFVSYGGVSGGLRSVQVSKLTLTALKMMPMAEGVMIPSYSQFLDADRNFKPSEGTAHSVKPVLDELHRWAVALKPMRG
jgi:NAD(P)H-dependent FMN reductase